MNVFTLFRDLRDALKRDKELEGVEQKKITEFHDAIASGNADLDCASLCIDSITLNIKNAEKKEGGR